MPANQLYEDRLQQFMNDIKRVSSMQPREKFLYPILDTPVFSDLQTALMMAKLNYKSVRRRK